MYFLIYFIIFMSLDTTNLLAVGSSTPFLVAQKSGPKGARGQRVKQYRTQWKQHPARGRGRVVKRKHYQQRLLGKKQYRNYGKRYNKPHSKGNKKSLNRPLQHNRRLRMHHKTHPRYRPVRHFWMGLGVSSIVPVLIAREKVATLPPTTPYIIVDEIGANAAIISARNKVAYYINLFGPYRNKSKLPKKYWIYHPQLILFLDDLARFQRDDLYAYDVVYKGGHTVLIQKYDPLLSILDTLVNATVH